MSHAIVFGGGGGKGAYQIGVWKALIDLNLDKVFSCAIGTSVGALNAAMFAQRNFSSAQHLWQTISTGKVMSANWNGESFCCQSNLEQLLAQAISGNRYDIRVYVCCTRIINAAEINARQMMRHVVSNGPIVRTVSGAIPIPLGAKVMGVDMAEEYQVEYIALHEQSSELQIRYLLASAAIPFAFEKVEIGDAYYRDGGWYDEHNFPFQKAVDFQYRSSLAIGLEPGKCGVEAIGNAKVFFLRPSQSLGGILSGTLDFDADRAKARIELGYRDTMLQKDQLIRFFENSDMGVPSFLKEEFHKMIFGT